MAAWIFPNRCDWSDLDKLERLRPVGANPVNPVRGGRDSVRARAINHGAYREPRAHVLGEGHHPAPGGQHAQGQGHAQALLSPLLRHIPPWPLLRRATSRTGSRVTKSGVAPLRGSEPRPESYAALLFLSNAAPTSASTRSSSPPSSPAASRRARSPSPGSCGP